jgi:hypothetical protein
VSAAALLYRAEWVMVEEGRHEQTIAHVAGCAQAVGASRRQLWRLLQHPVRTIAAATGVKPSTHATCRPGRGECSNGTKWVASLRRVCPTFANDPACWLHMEVLVGGSQHCGIAWFASTYRGW